MKLINDYNKALNAIYDHVKLKENWTVYPLDDLTQYHWFIHDDILYFDEKNVKINDNDIDIDDIDKLESIFEFSEMILYCVQYPEKIYRGELISLVLIDTMTDNNIFFAVLDNSKEIKECDKDKSDLL